MNTRGRPRLLDLFCGAGGAAMGYHRAGFDVTGIDIEPQPHYPFEFIEDDALGYLGDFHFERTTPPFDAIHASPPCQAYSALTPMSSDPSRHLDLVAPMRALLAATGLPYVIENVPGAPLRDYVTICGTSVGLPIVDCLDGRRQVYRHRLFETNWPLLVAPCHHAVPALGTYGNGGRWKRQGRRGGYQGSKEECFAGMGIDWMSRAEVAQAIPPAYTELIGHQLMAHLLPAVASEGRPS